MSFGRLHLAQAGTRVGCVDEERDAALGDYLAILGGRERQLVLADTKVSWRHDPALLEIVGLFNVRTQDRLRV
jgi:hypothetical protein